MRLDMNEILLPVEKAGLRFRNPFIVASGPASKDVSQLVEAERTGWGGASIKLAFDPEPYINPPPRYRWLREANLHIFSLETRLDFEDGLRLIEEGRKRTRELIIFANIAYVGEEGLEGWARMARSFEQAGAHIIELNLCCPNMSFNLEMVHGREDGGPSSGATVGVDKEMVSLITGAVKESVRIPVFAKLTPEGGKIGEVARSAVEAGAEGVCGTASRLVVPPIDINEPCQGPYRLTRGTSLACVSGPWVKPLALRDVLEMRRSVGAEPVVVGTGGIFKFQDAVEMFMVGADLVGICTAVMLHGFELLQKIAGGVKEYLRERGKGSLSEIRDEALHHIKPVTELMPVEGYAKVVKERCTGCGLCGRIAHCCAIEMRDGKAFVHREKCLGCSTCLDICPKNAIKLVRIRR